MTKRSDAACSILLITLLVFSSACHTAAPGYTDPPAESFTSITVAMKTGNDSAAVLTAAARVSESFFPVGPGPAPMPLIGRFLVPADFLTGATATVVISHALWTAKFGRAPAIIGVTIELDGRPTVVVGVGPPGFAPKGAGDVWLPRVSPATP